jgi:hypothetical protein
MNNAPKPLTIKNHSEISRFRINAPEINLKIKPKATENISTTGTNLKNFE